MLQIRKDTSSYTRWLRLSRCLSFSIDKNIFFSQWKKQIFSLEKWKKCTSQNAVISLLFRSLCSLCPLEALVLLRGTEDTWRTTVIMHGLGWRDLPHRRLWRENTVGTCFFAFFLIPIKLCEITRLPQPVTCLLAARLGGSRGSRDPCAGGRARQKPDSAVGTAAAHPDAPDSAAPAASCPGELGAERWGWGACSSGLCGKEPGQKVVM